MSGARRIVSRLLLLVLGLAPVRVSAQTNPLPVGEADAAPPPELASYLARPDAAFQWTLGPATQTPAGRVIAMTLVSQEWRGIVWSHQVRVYEPTTTVPGSEHSMLLFITGGSSQSQIGEKDDRFGFTVAEACGCRVAVLHQVPNQPLLDGKYEDDLIGQTFVQYLESQEPDLPLLFPMVKSAIRAMDALQEWGDKEGAPIDWFVVAGASKRGWTTWLTGAFDRRVKAIAPMVIPTLNMRHQNAHQLESWGKYSEQIDDYTRRGLTEQFDKPAGHHLWQMVDPYTYLPLIHVPVLQINGTNDRYWTVDSVRLFWDAIRGPSSSVVYLPNAGHGLDQNRDWAIEGLAALYRNVLADRPMPRFDWKAGATAGAIELTLKQLAPQPRKVSLWSAASSTRDFRESEWTRQLSADGDRESIRLETKLPETGYRAVMADLEFEGQGRVYHLSTPIVVFDTQGEVRPKPPGKSK